MKRTRVELKALLTQQAEEVIEELLDWYDITPTPNLTQIETALLQLRQKLGQEAAHLIVEQQETTHPEEAPLCLQCQRVMQRKGEKEKHLTTLLGQLHLERTYYYCTDCKVGFFPPGSAVGTT